MIVSKILGITLFFLTVTLWFIIAICLLFWAIPFIGIVVILTSLYKQNPWPLFQRWKIWGWFRAEIFNFKVYGQTNIPKERKNVIWALYPHGHCALAGIFYWALNPEFSTATAAVHSILFYIPIMNIFINWVGAIGVTEAELKNKLDNGKEIYMYPGGVADMVYIYIYDFFIYLFIFKAFEGNDYKKRRGIFRVARETKSNIIPVWCAEERSYYTQFLPFGHMFEDALGFPVPMFIWGKWWLPFWPNFPQESRLFIGKLINWDSPTQEQDFEMEMERLQNIADEMKSLKRSLGGCDKQTAATIADKLMQLEETVSGNYIEVE